MKLRYADFVLLLLVLSVGTWLFFPRTNEIKPTKQVTFNNVRVIFVGSDYLTFMRHGEKNGERIKIHNMKGWASETLEGIKRRGGEVDLTVALHDQSSWLFVNAIGSTPLPELPPLPEH